LAGRCAKFSNHRRPARLEEPRGGKAVIGSNVKVAAAGAILDVPLGHKDDSWSFPHFDTITVSVADAPRPDEIVVVTAIADGGRSRNQCGTEPIPIGATRTSCGCTRIPSDPKVRLWLMRRTNLDDARIKQCECSSRRVLG
jgi:Amino acid synthesis